jgi:H3 lysine-79-specific histone-lysine N-methyltransferase
LIHAAGIASIKQGFKPAFTGAQKEDCRVTLEYPGSDIPERYELVYRSDAFDPIEEIFGVVQEFAEFFVDEADRDVFLNPDRGIYRRLERARNLKSLEAFKTALNDYNEAVRVRRKAGTPQAILRKKHSLPESLIIRIMTQTYDRAVSPNVDLLRKYENGTNEIYGELKSNLVHKILVESKLDSKQVFVDLGSGVANVVLQAALQTGCESWGCEIMENACSLAEAQKKEFRARCRLWGIEPGNAYLEHGDFMANENIRKALLKADVVLVNNEVFTPTLNVSLVNLFLDLKEGCQIVSLKSFVPHNRKITNYNTNDPSNILRVERKTYSTKSVSWKDEGGEYFVATKDSARLKMYE